MPVLLSCESRTTSTSTSMCGDKKTAETHGIANSIKLRCGRHVTNCHEFRKSRKKAIPNATISTISGSPLASPDASALGPAWTCEERRLRDSDCATAHACARAPHVCGARGHSALSTHLEVLADLARLHVGPMGLC